MNQLIKVNFENSNLGCIVPEVLELVFLNMVHGQVGTLSRCRHVCKYFYVFMKEKNIFQRYIATAIPERPMVDYWVNLLRTAQPEMKVIEKQLFPLATSFDTVNTLNQCIKTYKNILKKRSFQPSWPQYLPFSLLYSILKSKRDRPLFQLANHIECLILNNEKDDIKFSFFKTLFDNFYDCEYIFLYGLEDNFSLFASIFTLLRQKNYLKELFAALPKDSLVQMKKDYANHLDHLIRNSRSIKNSLMKLALLSNDPNQEVSSESRRLLKTLIDDNDAGGLCLFLYTDRKIFLEIIIETNSFRHVLRAIFLPLGIISLPLGIHCLSTLFFSVIPLMHGAQILSVVEKDLLVVSGYLTAFLLNGLALSQILAPIERSLRYGINLDSWFYQYFCIFLVANLTLIVTMFLL